MGVLPLQFEEGTTAQTLNVDGSERFSITGLSDAIQPGQMLTLTIERKNSEREEIPVRVRIDTAIEVDYYRHGGILPFVLRELLARERK
jgi:aconitate hydratase